MRDQILRGDLQPGDEVPSERQIAADWDVARPTAARALEALRQQGFVESRQGSGTVVDALHLADGEEAVRRQPIIYAEVVTLSSGRQIRMLPVSSQRAGL